MTSTARVSVLIALPLVVLAAAAVGWLAGRQAGGGQGVTASVLAGEHAVVADRKADAAGERKIKYY